MNTWIVEESSHRKEYRSSCRLLLFWVIDNTPIFVRPSEYRRTRIFFSRVFLFFSSIFGSGFHLDKNRSDVMYYVICFYVWRQSRLWAQNNFSAHQIYSLKFSHIKRRQMESSKIFFYSFEITLEWFHTRRPQISWMISENNRPNYAQIIRISLVSIAEEENLALKYDFSFKTGDAWIVTDNLACYISYSWWL